MNDRNNEENYVLDVLNGYAAKDLDEFCMTYDAELDLNDGRIVGGRMNERHKKD